MMPMTTRHLVSILAAASLVAWGTQALACPGCGNSGGRNPMKGMERNADELGLTDDQLDAMQQLVDAEAPARDELRNATRAARDQLHALLDADEIDEGEVVAQVESIGALKTQKRVDQMRLRLALREIMSPEQRAQWRTIRSEHRRMKGMHHGKHARGPCADGECPQCDEQGCQQCGKHGHGCTHPHEGCDGSCPHAGRAAGQQSAGASESGDAGECPYAKAARERAAEAESEAPAP